MKKFSQINYDSQRNVVTIGAGLVWDDVYAALDPLGVGVFGERVAGVRGRLIAFRRSEGDYFAFPGWCC